MHVAGENLISCRINVIECTVYPIRCPVFASVCRTGIFMSLGCLCLNPYAGGG